MKLASALAVSIFFAVAGTASAADLLTENQMDNISAGGDISTIINASASTSWDVTTNNDHNLTVESAINTTGTATVVADTSSVGSSASSSYLAITVNNN